MKKTDKQWREQLTEEEYRVLRSKGTEVPFSGEFVMPRSDGSYYCKGCGARLFNADTQHESTLPGLRGWPSFDKAVTENVIELREDTSGGMVRTEAICSNCKSHLGHLFDDPTTPTGKHYCINSVCLSYRK
jgi:peptide-methionine (R)-S-oxide reductase